MNCGQTCRPWKGGSKSGFITQEKRRRRRWLKPKVTRLLFAITTFSLLQTIAAGSPFRYHHWGATGISSPFKSIPSVTGIRRQHQSLFSRTKAAQASTDCDAEIEEEKGAETEQPDHEKKGKKHKGSVVKRFPPRGGQGANTVVKVVGTATEILVQCGRLVLPPTAALVKFIVDVYRALPMDAIVAQVGLVYCFAGGYYPTLFSSLQAAQHCGWNIMVQAIQDLTNEALRVIYALEDVNTSQYGFDDDEERKDLKEEAKIKRQRAQSLFRRRTSVVLATVDPMKINQAAGALYTTWLGVSSVLEKEYARVITLSMTMAGYIEKVASFILAPPAYLCVAEDYHQWVPVVIGWGCKALAMNIAWRIQRLMTAATSAVTGGLLFARATSRMLSKRGFRLFGLIREDHESTAFDEIIGFMVAGLGFYAQFEAQWRNGFSFEVPFPFYLVTWPFDIAEKWIQWQITK